MLLEWLDHHSGSYWTWYVKRLSGNDTQLTGGHQAGPYFSNDVIFRLFPTLAREEVTNPRRSFPAFIDSHESQADVNVIWYNNRVVGDGTRNECRLTEWGGSASPLLDPDATGALTVFAFHQRDRERDAESCRIWLCRNPEEEDQVEAWLGEEVEPGIPLIATGWGRGALTSEPAVPVVERCSMDREEVERRWPDGFPGTEEILDLAIERSPAVAERNVDRRIIGRRECEYALFRSIESSVVLPRVREGFESVDEFVAFANSTLNRRKSRSGRSLELHVARILQEEDVRFDHDVVSEHNKRPDFLFPSAEEYTNLPSPDRLRMLGVKTTCKDRWRQILNEADRIPQKHLLTIQEGISENQFQEMSEAGVRLVVPSPLHRSYPKAIRSELLSFADFVEEVRDLS